MSEEQKTPEIVSENPKVIIEDNTSDRTEPITPDLGESTIDTADSDTIDSEVVEKEGVVSSEQEEVFTAFQQENANLKKLLDEKSNLADLNKAQYTRLAADFENFRRRTAKEKENLAAQAKKDVITLLLPVVDNFERARTQLKPETEGEKAIHSSYQGVYKTLVECLKKMGVSAMRPEGKEFDPNFHEAMLREQTNEYPEGTVIEQLMRGYTLGETILRHAMVKVAVPIEPVITSEEKNTQEEPQENNNP